MTALLYFFDQLWYSTVYEWQSCLKMAQVFLNFSNWTFAVYNIMFFTKFNLHSQNNGQQKSNIKKIIHKYLLIPCKFCKSELQCCFVIYKFQCLQHTEHKILIECMDCKFTRCVRFTLTYYNYFWIW